MIRRAAAAVFRRWRAAVACGLMAGAAVAWTAWMAPSSAAPAADQGAGAAQLYAQDCASCHGTGGTGTDRAPSLAGVGAAAVDFQLSTGRMPKRGPGPAPTPYRAQLSPSQISSLVRYVTALVAHGGPGIPTVIPSDGSVAVGGQVFREQCAACHGFAGTGGQLTDRPVPAVTEASPTQIGEAVRTGPDEMPVFGTQALSPQEVNSIAAYIEYMKHPYDRGGNSLSLLGPVSEGAVTFLVGLVALLGIMRWIGKRG